MCGILCTLISGAGESRGCSPASASCSPSNFCSAGKLRSLLSKRGPDRTESVQVSIGSFHIHLSGFVLWTQGTTVHPQPFISNDSSSYFVFNGDIYFVGNESIPNGCNDGAHLFNLIQRCSTDDELLSLISSLHGPFAFVLVNITKAQLWFGRDYFGRSSLLLHKENHSTSFSITSVAPISTETSVIEVPSCGIFCISLSSRDTKYFPWKCSRNRDQLNSSKGKFIEFMDQELNITVATGRELDPVAGCELNSVHPGDIKDTILSQLLQFKNQNLNDEEIIKNSKDLLQTSVFKLIDKLRQAVNIRVKCVPPTCKECMTLQRSSQSNSKCLHSRISVLFSGGLDSTILAHLVAGELTPGSELDLVNAAFGISEASDFSVPDRITGLESYRALKKAHPHIKINFVQVNITKQEVESVRLDWIKDLVFPLQSVLDDSIGCCLWFAARGKGKIRQQSNDGQFEDINYVSPARVVFVGSGADELFGGYSRHRTAYEQRGWQGLTEEIQEDLDRISIRNLGRDNRVITNNGVCARIPFLDENFVNFVTNECDVWIKCCPVFNRGIGEKLLLRCAVAHLLGDENLHIAAYPKRAMQFGSRIAKLENSKEKGGDICKRLVDTKL